MDIFGIVFLRLVSAAFVPACLIVILNGARRESRYEGLFWGVLALSVVALAWLTNGFLNENSRLLVFMYPLFTGFLFFLGPTFYYATTGKRISNLSIVILHFSTSFLLFAGGIHSNFSNPLTQEDFNLVFERGVSISSIPRGFLGDHFILLALLPIHFACYAFAAIHKTKERAHAVLIAPILSLIVLFVFLYTTADSSEWTVALGYVTIVVEAATLYFLLRFLSKDSPRRQRLRGRRLNIDPPSYEVIEHFLEDQKRVHSFFSQKVSTLDLLSLESNISKTTWRSYFSEEGISYSDFKKHMKISYAKRLIKEGYLNNYTVDSLAEAIGYSSRTSFYSVYFEVTGDRFESSKN